MKITIANTYIQQYKTGYSIHIQMPDGSRNYLHSQPFELQTALELRDEFVDQYLIRKESIHVIPDGKYFRLQFHLGGGKVQEVPFHSRKLNLNDAIYERMQLLISEE